MTYVVIPMPQPALTIWYNTRCPVCDAGINWQTSRLLPQLRSGIIVFRDINQEPSALESFGTDVNDVRRRLHAVDAEGRLIVGADVAIAIWRVTPGEAWLAKLFGNPMMLPVTRLAYNRFCRRAVCLEPVARPLVGASGPGLRFASTLIKCTSGHRDIQ